MASAQRLGVASEPRPLFHRLSLLHIQQRTKLGEPWTAAYDPKRILALDGLALAQRIEFRQSVAQNLVSINGRRTLPTPRHRHPRCRRSELATIET